jgi:hypothetical protein
LVRHRTRSLDMVRPLEEVGGIAGLEAGRMEFPVKKNRKIRP